MTAQIERELEAAIKSDLPLEEVVAVLRRCKQQGVSQREVYARLETWRTTELDDATDDRILEVADIVAGFCAPHLKVWGDEAR